jgi:uncharacterized membrane-anchored protein
MNTALCELCGEPMTLGEEMFKYHGLTGPCPKARESAVTFLEEFKKRVKARDYDAALKLLRADPAEPELVRAENERLRALLQRARQALRSLDEISDEELQRLADDLDAETQ